MATPRHSPNAGEPLLEETLNARNFPVFYRSLSQLRFPLRVSGVLELRALLNDTIDQARGPEAGADYIDFHEALESAIDSFGVERKHHRDRLMVLLTEIRNLHYKHSISSRDRELKLRERIRQNRKSRRNSVHYGAAAIVLAIGGTFAWMAMNEMVWLVQAMTVASLVLALDFFHALPVLDREHKRLNQKVTDLLRERVDRINWKSMIQKLALVLGYKTVDGVEVFRMESQNTQELH